MYSNTSFNYNYDLHAELKNKTGQSIKKFDVREVASQSFDASFAGGGIASGGQSYVVATNEDLSAYKKGAYSYQLVVDGTEYKVLSIGSNTSKTRTLGAFATKREYVIYLG